MSNNSNGLLPDEVYGAYLLLNKRASDLETFRRCNPKVFKEYKELIELYNSALGRFKNLSKAHADEMPEQVFEFKISRPREVDAVELQRLMGDAAKEFIILKPSINRKLYDEAIANGTISQEIALAVEDVGTPRIYGPKELRVDQESTNAT